LLGVPYAVLWGFLAGLLRYVPYIGPWIAVLFPITISLVAFSGWTQAGVVIGLFLLLELWTNMIMEPWLYGQSVGVSQVGLLVVMGFWTWLWGPIGLVLSAPLTVCIIVLSRYVPQLRFFDVLLGDQPVIEPAMVYYQRLLAQDQEEATELVEDYVHTHPPDTVYDDVLIPALLLAWQDRKQGALDVEDESYILQATRAIVEELDMTTEEAAGGTHPANEPPVQSAHSPVLILGCPARHEMEEVIVQMLGRLMARSGVPFRRDFRADYQRTPRGSLHCRVARRVATDPLPVYVPSPGIPRTRHRCRLLGGQEQF
jgi:hypothetical protein